MANKIEALLASKTGRPRQMKVRAILVALLLLALDDRPLHIKAATKLLFCRLPGRWRAELGINGEATGRKAFLARYRQARYLFHLVLALVDPSAEPKDRVLREEELVSRRKKLDQAELAARQKALEQLLAELLEASVRVCSADELAGFDGSVGLDATPVPLWSRGPSGRRGTCASDPDGGWYVREADHREGTAPRARHYGRSTGRSKPRSSPWGGRPARCRPTPTWPSAPCSAGRATTLAGTGSRVLASVRSRGWPAKYLGADRGYTQGLPERFHLPVRSLGYSLVMDYKATELGRQANSQGAVMVDGTFYCPAMPEDLISASSGKRAGTIDEKTYSSRISARRPWRLVRKSGPDADGYGRFACPAQGQHPHLCCPLRPEAKALGQVPVLSPPAVPPKVCTQSSITVAPDIGARHRQDLAFGSDEWASTYAAYRNTVEGWNGYVKDTAHEALAAPGRRRVRGIAAQSIFVALLLMAANFRKIVAFRQLVADRATDEVAARARRRRVSLADYGPPA